MREKFFRKIVKISLVSIILAAAMFQFSIHPAKADALTSMSDTLTRLKISELADHEVKWTLPGGKFSAGDKAMVYFGGGTFVADTNWTTSDFAFNDGTARTIVAVGVDVDPVCTGGVDDVTVRVDTTKSQFDVLACPGYTASAPGASVTFNIYGTSPNGTLTNPAAAATYQVYLVGDNKGDGFNANDDNGFIALAIVTDDEVVITATVDPTFTFAIYRPGTTTPTSYCWSASNTVQGFGTIANGNANVDTCEYDVYTNTNAKSGYVTTLVAVDDGSGGNGRYALNNDATPTVFFDPEDGDNAVIGSQTTASEYGVGSSEAEFIFIFPPPYPVPVEATCNEDSLVNARSLYDATGVTPVLTLVAYHGIPGAETNTVCHAAAAGAVTPTAGTYKQTVTLISTGKF